MEPMAAQSGAQVVPEIVEASDQFGRLIGTSESSLTSVPISSLRERPEDLLGLMEHFARLESLTSPSHSDAAPGGLERIERDAIVTSIWTHSGNLSRVARDLRISRSTLYLKLKKYALESVLLEVRRGP